jgi:ABC-type Mn2+/Zn2+ transport system permease subunit
MTFVALALSELAACGVALGLWIHFAPPVIAAVTCFAGIGLLAIPSREEICPREGQVGAIYAFCAASALLLMALNPMARTHGFDLFAGDLLYTGIEHIITLSILVVVTIIGAVLFGRKLLFTFYDREMAFSLGLPVRRLDLGFLLTVSLVIACSLRVAGVVFVFSSLVLPPFFGLALGGRIKPALVIAPLGAMSSTIAGLYFSYHMHDIPAGPAIVICYGILSVLAFAIRFLVVKSSH